MTSLNSSQSCQSCFKVFDSHEQPIKVDQLIEERFLSVIQLNFKNSSTKICSHCDRKLKDFSEFKDRIRRLQLECYGDHPFEIVIKPEDPLETNNEVEVDLMIDEKIRNPSPTKIGKNRITIAKNSFKKTNFVCDNCGYRCFSKYAMSVHMVHHIPEELRQKIPCSVPDCKFVTTSKESFRTHTRKHTSPRDKDKVLCDCGKVCSTKYQLKIHIKNVHEGKRFEFKCQLCPKAYMQKNNLKVHMEIHHLKRKAEFFCEFCSKCFVLKDQLKKHIKLHHTVGKLQCPHPGCTWTFHEKSRLNNHILVHSKLKTFHCDECPSVYRDLTTLLSHKKTSHQGLRFHCEVPSCNEIYVKKQSLLTHIRKSHSDLEPDLYENLLNQLKNMKPS